MRLNMIYILTTVFLVFLCAGCNISTTPAPNSSMVGPNNQEKILPPPPDEFSYEQVISISGETIYLKDHYRESPDRKVANITYKINDEYYDRQFVMEKTASPDGFTNYSILLLDNDNNLMWEITAMIDTLDLYHFGLRERTAQDQLDIMVSYRNGIIAQDYDLNGKRFYVEYTEEQMDKFLHKTNSRGSQAKSVPTDDLSNLSVKYEEFIEFYPENISLNDNTDGVIAMDLLQSDEFSGWMMEDSELPEFNLDIEELCDWAKAVAPIKCIYGGGWANPICHVAAGIAIACLIVDLID